MVDGLRQSRRRTSEPSAFTIALSKGNGRPLFLQLHEQIIDRIAAGELTPGMRLPPVRRLAEQLGINHMTVAKAYKDLAAAGFVEGARAAERMCAHRTALNPGVGAFWRPRHRS